MLPCTLSCFGSIMLDLMLASSHVLGFHLQFSVWMCLPVYASVCEIHCPQPVHKQSLMRASVMKKKWREEGLPYADLLKVDLSVNPLCMCLCACVGAAQVLQGHEAVMHEKIKCTCAATPGHSWTDFHYCIWKVAGSPVISQTMGWKSTVCWGWKGRDEGHALVLILPVIRQIKINLHHTKSRCQSCMKRHNYRPLYLCRIWL